MKIITVPESFEADVVARSGTNILKTNVKFEFGRWLQEALDAYVPLGKGPKAQRQAAKIASIIEKANGTMAFEDADFEVVKEAALNMQWPPSVNRKAGAFWNALENAQDTSTKA